MKLLQIGLGRFGQSHLRTWRKLGVDLRVSDLSPACLEAVSEPSSRDWRALLDDADAVDIVTPVQSHAEIAREAIARGKHVLVEKPIAETAAEGVALARQARAAGVVLQVGHVFRFAPESRAAAKLLQSGALGRLRYAAASFSSFKRPRPDGGMAIADGVHFVDLLSWLLGRQPDAVTAVMRDHLGRGTDDFALLALDYGGTLGLVEAGCFRPDPCREVQIVGTEGALVCDFLAGDSRVRHVTQRHRRDPDGTWQVDPASSAPVPVEGEEPLLAELRAFSEACASGRPSAVAADGFAGAAAVAAIEAAERSAAEGHRVEISPVSA